MVHCNISFCFLHFPAAAEMHENYKNWKLNYLSISTVYILTWKGTDSAPWYNCFLSLPRERKMVQFIEHRMSIDYLGRMRSLLADLAEETIQTVSLRGQWKFSLGVRSLQGKPRGSFPSSDPASGSKCPVSKKGLNSQIKTTRYIPLRDVPFPLKLFCIRRHGIPLHRWGFVH